MTVRQTKDVRMTPAERRKAALSPEVSEVLHMLKSLEAELDSRQVPAR